MSFFSKTQDHENTSFPQNITVTLTKSWWERLGSFIWGLLKLIIILGIVGLIIKGSNDTIQEFSPYEKNYYDAFYRTESSHNESTQVAVLDLSGVIVSQYDGGFDPSITVSKDFIAMLADTMDDDEIDAVLIKVNSPGGEVFASEEIAQAIDILKANSEKPVYVVLETMAASGGYYIASSGTKIFSYPDTLLGNIGVRIDLPNIEGLLGKVGVKMKSITSGKLKTMGSPFREMTEEEEKIFSDLIDESYETFVQRVATGRNISPQEVKKLADGRIFSGRQGKENGLVDEIVTSLPDLSATLARDLKVQNIQFVGFASRMTPFEKFLLSVQTGINPLSAKISSLHETKFLMQ